MNAMYILHIIYILHVYFLDVVFFNFVMLKSSAILKNNSQVLFQNAVKLLGKFLTLLRFAFKLLHGIRPLVLSNSLRLICPTIKPIPSEYSA